MKAFAKKLKHLLSYPVELLAGLVHSPLIPAVHHKDQSCRVRVVMLPMRPHPLLASHVPDCQTRAAPVRLQRLHVEAHRRHGRHVLVVLQLVQQGRLSRSVQPQQQDLRLFLTLGSMCTHVELSQVSQLFPPQYHFPQLPYLYAWLVLSSSERLCSQNALCTHWQTEPASSVVMGFLLSPTQLSVKLFISKVTLQPSSLVSMRRVTSHLPWIIMHTNTAGRPEVHFC